MIETIASMWLPLTVLTVAGLTTLGLGWWLSVKAEGHDEWILGTTTEKETTR